MPEIWKKPDNGIIEKLEFVFNGVKVVPSFIIWTAEVHPKLVKKTKGD